MKLLKLCRLKPVIFLLWTSNCLLLPACSMISPDYQKPRVDVPQEWSHLGGVPLKPAKAMPYLMWWQRFNDPTLNALIQEGLQNNNTVQQAYAHLEKSKGELKAIQMSWLPNVSSFLGYSTNPALGVPNNFYGIWPQYAIFNMFNTIALEKSATLEVAVQQKAVESAQLLLIGQIATSYYTYLAQVNQYRLFKRYVRDLQEIVSIQKANYQAGIKNDIQVQAVRSQLNMAQSQQKTIQGNILKSQNALRYLLNKNPGSIRSPMNFDHVVTEYANIATLPATVLADRPDVALAELQYRLSVQNKAKAYTSLLPAVQLDSFQGAANLNHSFSSGSYVQVNDAYIQWTLNPSVFGQIEAYNAEQKAAYYQYIDTVRKALQEVDNALINHEIANQRYQLIKKSYKSLATQYAFTYDLYQAGIAAYEKTLQDKLKVDTAAIAVNQIKLWQMITLINLYQDLGGGYRMVPSRSTFPPLKRGTERDVHSKDNPDRIFS